MDKKTIHKIFIGAVKDLANPRQPFKLVYSKPYPYCYIEILKTTQRDAIKMQK